MTWAKITSNTTAVNNKGYLISAAANLTVTLPLAPTEGDKVGVVDADGKATTYTLTVARNGSNIEGAAADLTITTDRDGFVLVYSDATQGWVRASSMSSGGGGLSWAKTIASATASKDNGYLLVPTANITLTLPATPTEGDKVGVSDASGLATTYTMTVARNGSNIQGLAQDLTIDTNNSGFILVYVDATQGWVIVSEITGFASPMVWGTSTVSETATADRGYLTIPTAAYTLTLPVSPAVGDRVGFRDVGGLATTYAMTIARNGEKIEGVASDLTIDTDKSGFMLVYTGTVYGWVIVTELNSINGSSTSTNSITQLQAWAFE